MRTRIAAALALGLSLAGPVTAYELDEDPFWSRVSTMMPSSDVSAIRTEVEKLPEEVRAIQLRVFIWQALGRSQIGGAEVIQQQLMLDTVADYEFVGPPCDGLFAFDLWADSGSPQTFKATFVLAAFMDNFLQAKPLERDTAEAETASRILNAGPDRFRLKTIRDDAGSACFIEKLEN